MSIIFKSGSIFDSDCEALVNPVNCVGVMGKGLALEFKERFPKNYKYYVKSCKRREPKVGNIVSMYSSHNHKVKPSTTRRIINAATKQHWKDKSTIENIEKLLRNLVEFCSTECIKSVAIPKLGCSCGGLDWNDVKPLIIEICGKTENITFEIYE